MKPALSLAMFVLGVGLALFGALALRKPELLPAALRAAPATAPVEPSEACPPPSAAASNVAPPAATLQAPAPVRVEPPLVRFHACDLPRGLVPQLSLQSLSDGTPSLAALHCGSSLQLIALSAANAEPERILQLTITPPRGELIAQPAKPTIADIDGDGRRDLLAPFFWLDATAAPRGGALYELVRSAHGGFAEPRALGTLPVAASAALLANGRAAAELALLQLEDAHIARPSQLVVLHGGAAPLRALTVPIAVGARDLQAVDLDLDGVSDLCVLGQTPSVELLYAAADGGIRERVTLEAPNARAIAVTDLDGDGHDDLLVIGDTVHVMLATSGERSLRALATPTGLVSVGSFDLDADGKRDLVGYAAPLVLGFLQPKPFELEQRALLDLGSAPFDVLAVSAFARSPRGKLGLLVLGRERDETAAVSLAVVSVDLAEARNAPLVPRWNTTPEPLAEAQLATHAALP